MTWHFNEYFQLIVFGNKFPINPGKFTNRLYLQYEKRYGNLSLCDTFKDPIRILWDSTELTGIIEMCSLPSYKYSDNLSKKILVRPETLQILKLWFFCKKSLQRNEFLFYILYLFIFIYLFFHLCNELDRVWHSVETGHHVLFQKSVTPMSRCNASRTSHRPCPHTKVHTPSMGGLTRACARRPTRMLTLGGLWIWVERSMSNAWTSQRHEEALVRKSNISTQSMSHFICN